MSRARKLRMRQERKEKESLVVNESISDNIIFRQSHDKMKFNFKIYLKDGNRKINTTKIVAYTSISPNHLNAQNQLMAIESWYKAGIEIYSLNSSEEIDLLRSKYPSYVNFIHSKNNTKHIFGKPCILINEMLNHFYEKKTGDIIMLINSDIILSINEELLTKIKSISEISIPISHRIDFKQKTGEKYIYGFDVFFIHKKYIKAFPPAMYSMGQTWWDYWLPYTALKNNIPVFLIEDAFAFHKEHATQYNANDWMKMTEYFKWENNIAGDNYQEINDNTRNKIIHNSISFNLCQNKRISIQ